jgi:hypothetical protein
MQRTAVVVVLSILGCSVTTPDRGGSEDGTGSRVEIEGGETSDFGDGEQPVCRETERAEVTLEQARALDLGLDSDLELIAPALELPFHWGPVVDCDGAELPTEDTRLGLRLSVDRIDHVSFTPVSGENSSCEDRLEYRALVELETNDERLEGVFYARLVPSAAGLQAHAIPDLRNFSGDLRLELDSTRPYWGVMDTNFELSPEGSRGSLQILVSYTDSTNFERKSGAGGFWFAGLEGILCGLGAEPAPGPSVIPLDAYAASPIPPTMSVKVRADAVEPAEPVDVTIEVDGELTEHQNVDPGQILELGPLHPGSLVTARVSNSNGAGFVRANILANDCFVASAGCGEAACVAESSYRVELAFCSE